MSFKRACITWNQWYYSIYIWFCVILLVHLLCIFGGAEPQKKNNNNTSMRCVIWKRHMWVCLDPPAAGYFSWNCGTCQLPDTWQMNEQDDQIQIKGLPTAILKLEKASWLLTFFKGKIQGEVSSATNFPGFLSGFEWWPPGANDSNVH